MRISPNTTTPTTHPLLQTFALGLSALVAGVSGASAAVALAWSLQMVGDIRSLGGSWIVWLLPVAGFILGVCIDLFGLDNLTTTRVLQRRSDLATVPSLPKPMGIWALLGTTVTHLFGASAGREGAAIQLASSVALSLSKGTVYIIRRLFALDELTANKIVHAMLSAAIAAGFAATFRTPIGAAVFSVEVRRGREDRPSITEICSAVVGGVVGELIALSIGPKREIFKPAFLAISLQTVAGIAFLAIATTLAVAVFTTLIAAIKSASARFIPSRPLRMASGAIVLVALWQLVDTTVFIGLGTQTISNALHGMPVETWAFALKIMATAITLGVGFPGGEVTPLFFIGATLGSVCAPIIGLPGALASRVGMLTTFGVAASIPWAVGAMALDLFGLTPVAPLVFICAYGGSYLYGRHSIYEVAGD